MYIVNQSKDKTVKISSIDIVSSYPIDIQNGLHEIYSRISSKAYNYGSTERCNMAIKEEQSKFLIDKQKDYYIIVNDLEFASYKTELEVQEEFNNITNAINENRNIYFLR